MPKVQLKIEVNDDAETESLGDITNQVNGEGSNANVSNVSIQASDSGIYVVGAMNKNGREMLSFGEDGNLVFNIDGFLSSDGVRAGALASEQEPDMFVWGVVPENKEYHVKLTFINAKNLREIVVYGDPVSGQFPTEAIVNGITTIYSDDNRWAINLGSESSTHTIEFTKWSRAGYNACLTLIKVMLRYFDIANHTGLLEVESLSQSNSSPKEIMYGVVPSTGRAKINVFDELRDLIEEGIITNNKNAVEIYVDGTRVQHHITTDSDYETNKVLTMEFENHLSFMENIYAGRNLTDSMTAYALLKEVLGTLNYTAEQVDSMLQTNIVYGENEDGTVKSYLENITIEYPYLESDTYRKTLNKFCTLAQLNLLEDDNGNFKFVSARPLETKDSEIIVIPVNKQFSTFRKDEFIKNKYKKPFVGYRKVFTETGLFGETKTASYIEDNGETRKALFITNWNTEIRPDYSVYLPTYNKTGKNPLYNTTTITTRNGQEYYKTTLSLPIPKDVMLKSVSDLKLGINGNMVGTNQFTYENDDPDTDIPTHITQTYRPYKTANFDVVVDIQEGQSSSFEDIIIENVQKNKDFIQLDILFSVYNGEAKIITSIPEYRKIYITSTNFQLYGTTYRVSDSESEQINDVEIFANELVQEGTIYKNGRKICEINSDNILTDYARGIRTAKISVACLDYYNTKGELAIDWSKQEMFKVGQVVRVDKDNLGNSVATYAGGAPYYWKITGRNFRYSGVPMIDLELQEVKFNGYFVISENVPSYINVTYTRVYSEVGASIGVIDKYAKLYNGDIIKVEATGNEIYDVDLITINEENYFSGGVISVHDNLNVKVTSKVKTFTITQEVATGATLNLNRILSPYANASLGKVTNNVFYYGDVIEITYSYDSGYSGVMYLNGNRIFDNHKLTITSNNSIQVTAEYFKETVIFEGEKQYALDDFTSSQLLINLPVEVQFGYQTAFEIGFEFAESETPNKFFSVESYTNYLPININALHFSQYSGFAKISLDNENQLLITRTTLNEGAEVMLNRLVIKKIIQTLNV